MDKAAPSLLRRVPPVLWLILVAALMRLPTLGQPILNLDDQLYLAIGDAMLDGAWPYVDVWDRKPPGIFAIYAAIRLLGGTGVWQFQLVALASIVATALVIHRIALYHASPVGALLAALAYVAWSALTGGATGQTPVFYNLPMALAGLLIVGALAEGISRPRVFARCMAAMVLAGIALVIKPSASIEAAMFGLIVLALLIRSFAALRGILLAGLCAFVLALPTLAAGAIWYAGGHFTELWFATVESVGLRAPMPRAEFVHRLLTSFAMVLPLFALAAYGWRHSAPREHLFRWFVYGWLLVSVLALAAYGGFFSDHYMLPTLVPATICAAPAFARWRHILPWLAGIALALAVASQALLLADRANSGGWQTLATLDKATQDQRNCPFLFDGPPVAYVVLDWCKVTPFVFTGHLNFGLERNGLPVDPMAEVRRVLDTRPDRVIIRKEPVANANLETRALVLERLKRDYRPIAEIEPDGLLVYALRPGIAPRPNALPLHGAGIPAANY